MNINSPFQSSKQRRAKPYSLMLAIQVLIVSQSIFAAQELEELSLEQLLSVEVTSATRKKQTLGEVAGAMFVISAEDIRRSGVTSVAEALRMVPGVHVGRIDDTRWAVTARGFNDQLSNKLLVMMDGRHISTPDFAGVFWSDHMPLIDNVERIEVIRGPGATTWGSNAVNGVINIISRSARDTQGLFLQARGGNREMSGMTFRYGDVTDSGWYYRYDIHAVEENLTDSPLTANNPDFLEQQRGSFRIDGNLAENHSLRFEGSYYLGASKEIVQPQRIIDNELVVTPELHDLDSHGAWLMAQWRNDDGDDSHWNLTGYVDKKYRDFSLGEFTQNTLSLQLQRRKLLAESHEVIWGIGSRVIDLPFNTRSFVVEQLPSYQERQYIHELFVQDEIAFSEIAAITAGLKAERSEHIDWEIQPSLKFSWQASVNTTLWISASEAVRAPASGERGLRIRPGQIFPAFSPTNPGPLAISTEFVGNDDFDSERLTAIEAGIKGSLSENFEYDLALFDFSYKDILAGELEGIYCVPDMNSVLLNPICALNSDYLLARSIVSNKGSGSSQGAELAVDWYPLSNWHLKASFSWFNYDLGKIDDSLINALGSGLNASDLDEPEWISYLRSEWTIRNELELDVTIRAVDESKVFGIDSYTTADVRLEWKPRPDLRFELIGHNLLDRGHLEYGSRLLDALPSEILSGVIARVTWAP